MRCFGHKNLLLVGFVLLFSFSIHSGEDSLQVGYATIDTAEGVLPETSALFGLRVGGTLVSEAAVAAVEPIRRGRLFVDRVGPQTGVALANSSANPVRILLSLNDSEGVLTRQSELDLAPGQHIAQFVQLPPALFPGLPASFEGTLTFEGETADDRVAAVTIRQSRNSRGEALFATLPVVQLPDEPQQVQGNGSDTRVLPHLAAGGPLTTEVLVMNASPIRAQGTLALTGSDGLPLALEADGVESSEFAYDLPPNASLRALLTSSTGVRQGYGVLSGTAGPLPAATAVFQFRDSMGEKVSEAGVAARAATRRSRIFVDNVRTQTGFAVSNQGNPGQTLQVRLLSRQGEQLGVTTLELPANGHDAVFADELFPDLPGTFTGLIELESDLPVVPITLKLSTNERGDLIVTTLPLADMELAGHPGRVILPQIGFGRGFSTRVLSISRTEQEEVNAELALFDSAGEPLLAPIGGGESSQVTLHLAAGGSSQQRPGLDVPVAEVLVDAFQPGVLELTVETGSNRRLSPVALDADGNVRDDLPFEFASLSPEVASVDSQGTVTGHENGFSTLTYSSGGVVNTSTIAVVGVREVAPGLAITGVSQDLSGRLYLVGRQRHAVFRSDSFDQQPELWAGRDGNAGLKDDQRLAALFNEPSFNVLNQADGSIFVSDSANHVIRRIFPGDAGGVATYAGTGQPGHLDGDREQAQFDFPHGVALDPYGNLWVVDQGSHTIRRISSAGVVETVAGESGSAGLRDGRGAGALFNSPSGITLESESVAQQLERQLLGELPPPVAMLVADTGNGVLRRVFEDGRVETVAVNSDASATVPPGLDLGITAPGLDSPVGISTDAFGRTYVSEPERNRVQLLLPDGDLVPLTQPGGIIAPRGISTSRGGRVVVAGEDRPAREFTFGEPEIDEIFNDVQGSSNHVTVIGRNFSRDTRVVIPRALVEDFTVADSRTLRFTLSTDAVDFGGDTSINVSNRGGVRQIQVAVSPDGEIFTRSFLLISWLTEDIDVGPAGNIFFTTSGRLLEITAVGQLLLPVAGGLDTVEVDSGPARQNRLSDRVAIEQDPSGNLIVVEIDGHRIRRIDRRTGIIAPLAGSGEAGFSGDGGPASVARFNLPEKAILSPSGDIFVADTGNHRIRKIDRDSGVITTVAGSGVASFCGDGQAATVACLNNPVDLAIFGEKLYVADAGNFRIREIDLGNGVITTVAGDGSDGFGGDGGLAHETSLSSPRGLDVAADGALFVVLTDRVIRIEALVGGVSTVAGGGSLIPEGPPDEEPIDVPATDAKLSSLGDVATDAAGNLYIIQSALFGRLWRVDSRSGTLRRVPYDLQALTAFDF